MCLCREVEPEEFGLLWLSSSIDSERGTSERLNNHRWPQNGEQIQEYRNHSGWSWNTLAFLFSHYAANHPLTHCWLIHWSPVHINIHQLDERTSCLVKNEYLVEITVGDLVAVLYGSGARGVVIGILVLKLQRWRGRGRSTFFFSWEIDVGIESYRKNKHTFSIWRTHSREKMTSWILQNHRHVADASLFLRNLWIHLNPPLAILKNVIFSVCLSVDSMWPASALAAPHMLSQNEWVGNNGHIQFVYDSVNGIHQLLSHRTHSSRPTHGHKMPKYKPALYYRSQGRYVPVCRRQKTGKTRKHYNLSVKRMKWVINRYFNSFICWNGSFLVLTVIPWKLPSTPAPFLWDSCSFLILTG